MNKITTTKKHLGFSLLEVMVALVISSIALLGMAAGQLKSLQYATNSFDYTLALLQANNAVEQTWGNLCQLQNDQITFNANKPMAQFDSKFEMLFTSNSFEDTDNENDYLVVTVSWTDARIKGDDKVEIEASFPDISRSCK
jgi:type IV pilus assembly protein PilV